MFILNMFMYLLSRKKYRYMALSSWMNCARLDSELETGVEISYLLGAGRGSSKPEVRRSRRAHASGVRYAAGH